LLQRADACVFPYKLEKGQELVLDWERKRTGWISITGSGTLEFTCAGDIKILEILDSDFKTHSYYQGDKFPNNVMINAQGMVDLTSEPKLIRPRMMALRYLRLRNLSDSTATISFLSLKPSEFPEKPVGSFECSDEAINVGWQMGIDTVHLCTQPGEESQSPVFGPFGNGYVQWDGCRRDREIWGGDLRPASLAWYYNWQDQTPVANSLYLIMSAQHNGCSEHGLFPGSGSSHQIFYEWAFWESVCLWEYILHTGDQSLMRFARQVMPTFLDWCERKFSEHPDGWIHASASWMYTIPIKDEPLPALQAAAAIGLEAMEKLFLALDNPGCANRSRALRENIASRFHKSFWDESLQAYLFVQPKEGDAPHSDLTANAWAIIGDLAPEDKRQTVLDSMKRLHWRDAGSINISPILGITCSHDNNIWPYANAYEVTARFEAGDVDGALEVFKRYINTIRGTGHHTVFEMINLDGSLPIQHHIGDVLSFSHAWASQASWALQRYILGVYPVKPGWSEFACDPIPSPLEWAKGSIVTPHGVIDVELENKNGALKGKVTHPESIKPSEKKPEGIEFTSP
jgi:hypothetical protein